MDDAALFDLLSWMSPAWPIGGFAYSGGIEWAVEAGHVTTRASAQEWILAMLEEGSLWNEAVIFTHSWRAAQGRDVVRMTEVAQLAAASLTSAERRLESTAQAAAFRRIASVATPAATLETLAGVEDGELAYPVVVGALAAGRGIAARPALMAWLHAAVANFVSAALRLVPLGQTDGQIILAAMKPHILALAQRAVGLPDGDPFMAMASATPLADFATMAHETQYTRLFRT